VPLLAGMMGALLFALVRHRTLVVPGPAFRIAQGVIGVSVGVMIDWGRLRDLGTAWTGVLVVCLATLVLSVAIGQLMRVHRGTSRSTATFSALAGAATGMTAMAADYDADDRVVTVMQYLRVLIIVATVPFVVSSVFGTGTAVIGPSHAEPGVLRGLVLVALAVCGGLVVGGLLHLPSPAILGGLVAGAALALLPVFDGAQVPSRVQDAAFLLIGAQVGLKFTWPTLWRLAKMMPVGLVVIALVILACAGLGLLLSQLTGASRVDGYLATTPGGLPAVLASATSSGADVTFVSTVQLVRVLVVFAAAPLVARWYLKDRDR
jgi:membrane AbrB-like protein